MEIAITVLTSNGGKTVNGVFATRRSNIECAPLKCFALINDVLIKMAFR